MTTIRGARAPRIFICPRERIQKLPASLRSFAAPDGRGGCPYMFAALWIDLRLQLPCQFLNSL